VGFETRFAPLGLFGNDKSRIACVAHGRTGQLTGLRRSSVKYGAIFPPDYPMGNGRYFAFCVAS
jgi:hypothetical protein